MTSGRFASWSCGSCCCEAAKPQPTEAAPRGTQRVMAILGAVALSALCGASALARTYVIRPDGTGDHPTIQAGIDACAPGDTLLLEDGTFTGPGNRDLDCRGLSITIRSMGGPEACVLDAELSGRGFWFRSGETRDCVVAGLTIRAGSCWNECGGGVLCSNGSSPTMQDVVIRECMPLGWLQGHGGGVACVDGAAPLLLDCHIIDNATCGGAYATRGGGVYAESAGLHMRQCVLAGNIGDGGGGISLAGASAFLENCSVTGNHSGNGGGLHLSGSSEAVITECTIAGNMVWGRGGGVYCDSVTISRSILWGNCSGYVADLQARVTGSLLLDCCVVDSSGIGGPGMVAYLSGVFTDPVFCDPTPCDSAPTTAGDYRVDAGSPCVPDQNPCGVWIGAMHVGCPTSNAPGGVALTDQTALRILPNPVRGGCSIWLEFPSQARARVDLLDAGGRVLRSLWEGVAAPGRLDLRWDGGDDRGRILPARIYWARMRTSGRQSVRQLVIVR
jgi:hypothetical protein